MSIPLRISVLLCAMLGYQSSAWAAFEGDRDPSFNGGQPLSVYVPYNDATDDTPALIGLGYMSNGFLAAIRYGAYPSYTVQLVRILEDGTLSPNFGIDGVRDLGEHQIDWGAMATYPGPDTIVLAGSTAIGTGGQNKYNFHIVRLDSYGTVDSTFNGNTGYNDTTPGLLGFGYNHVYAATVLPSTFQTIVVGTVATAIGEYAMAIVRLNGNGTTDNSFNNIGGIGGGATYSFPLNGANDATATTLVVDGHARILLAGSAQAGTGTSAVSEFAAVRFTSTGAVDTCMNAQNVSVPCAINHAFHLGGAFNDEATSIKVDQNDKIYLLGSSSYAKDSSGNDESKNSILRLTDQFLLDTTYNPSAGNESFLMQNAANESDVYPSAVVDAKNRFMVVGGNSSTEVARFVPSGAYDTTYNNGSALYGRAVAIPYGTYYQTYGKPRILLDGDRPVVAAIFSNGTYYSLQVTRLLGDKIFSDGFL